MKSAPSKNAMTKSEPTDMVAMSDFGSDFMMDAGLGFENADHESYAIPFLKVLSKVSPQVDETAPQYVEGAKAGMFFNSVSEKLYAKDEVQFLPCAYTRSFLKWGPRTGENAGFKGEMTPAEYYAMKAKGLVVQYDGREYLLNSIREEVNPKSSISLRDTRSHFGILLDPEEGPQRMVIALSSTQIKKSKQLLTLLSNVQVNVQDPKTQKSRAVVAPTWFNVILLESVAESNEKGSWHGVKFSIHSNLAKLTGFDSPALYEMAKEFNQTVIKGQVEVNYASMDVDGGLPTDHEDSF